MLFEINTSSLSSHRESLSSKFYSDYSAQDVLDVALDLGIYFRIRVFDPLTTLFAFLTQIFSSDRSCLSAVSSLIAMKEAQKLPVCCLNSGSFSKAKARLPIDFFCRLAKKAAILPDDCWKHGRVIVVDGTGVSMPDTAANRQSFPLRKSNRYGFPGARLVAMFSLSSGSLIDLAMGPMKGKGTGEASLLMRMWENLKSGDTLLGDSLFSSFAILCRAQENGVHVVSEMRPSRAWRLKKNCDDQIISIEKSRVESKKMREEDTRDWPDQIKVRVIKLRCAPNGFRPKIKYILTTLLDKNETPATEVLGLYQKRWQVELNFRSIKTTLGMDVLRGLSPQMVIKEVWVHALAYNMIRSVIYKASAIKGIPSTMLSFKSAQQLFHLARTILSVAGSAAEAICANLLKLITTQKVGGRPNRYEPRVLKRRKKNFTLMSESRASAKRRLHKKRK